LAPYIFEYVIIKFRYISKDNKGIVYEWTSSNTELSISQVVFSNDIQTFKKIPSLERDEEVYTGPDFVSLNEDIQKGLSDFLIDTGIDQQTIAFIEIMSMDKEQRLYMSWLQDVQKFIRN